VAEPVVLVDVLAGRCSLPAPTLAEVPLLFGVGLSGAGIVIVVPHHTMLTWCDI
jgi:hypothetical protein